VVVVACHARACGACLPAFHHFCLTHAITIHTFLQSKKGTALGATLVHELACFRDGSGGSDASHSGVGQGAAAYGTALPGILRRFRARVEAALPGIYAFFDEQSLHVTVRGLVP
jgi:hypothetical protein